MPRGIYERRPYMKTYPKLKGREQAILSLYRKTKRSNLHPNDPRNHGGVAEIAQMLDVTPNGIYWAMKKAASAT